MQENSLGLKTSGGLSRHDLFRELPMAFARVHQGHGLGALQGGWLRSGYCCELVWNQTWDKHKKGISVW